MVDSYTYIFSLKYLPKVPINVSSIRPEDIAGKNINEIQNIQILYGSRKIVIEEIFDVDGYSKAPRDADRITIIFRGYGTRKLWYVGYMMSRGNIVVDGDVGPLTGYKMSGGSIVVKGNTGKWLGAEMSGGNIYVYGNGEDFIGGRTFFSNGSGMSGGRIVVYGSVGSYIGYGMRGGYIEVHGNAGDFIGMENRGGTIVVKGSSGIYPGIEMINGTIIVCKGVELIAPGFIVSNNNIDIYNPCTNDSSMNGIVLVGDILVNGFGKIIVFYNEKS